MVSKVSIEQRDLLLSINSRYKDCTSFVQSSIPPRKINETSRLDPTVLLCEEGTVGSFEGVKVFLRRNCPMKKDVVLPTSLGETREQVQADPSSLCSKEFGPVMETQIAAVDREKQRALEQKARELASKD